MWTDCLSGGAGLEESSIAALAGDGKQKIKNTKNNRGSFIQLCINQLNQIL
jgi:hypothetical protein